MSDPKQAQVLLEAAERDVAALRGMGDTAVFADEIFGFHVQQAAEKLFKAWLASLGETYPLSHDLAALLDLLSARGVNVVGFDELVDFTRYAVRLRYAGADPGAHSIDRGKSLEQVETLLDAVGRQRMDAREV